jgi:hypothetical protein
MAYKPALLITYCYVLAGAGDKLVLPSLVKFISAIKDISPFSHYKNFFYIQCKKRLNFLNHYSPKEDIKKREEFNSSLYFYTSTQ